MVKRLRAPSTDGALFAEPPLDQAASVLAANDVRLDAWDHDFQGRRADALRSLVRKQVLERAREFAHRHGLSAPAVAPSDVVRLAVTGHQPELFHPGVWVKNFATAAVAESAGAVGLNLIVDDDTPKSSEIRVPFSDGESLTVQRVAFDEWQGELPYEDLAVGDEARFATFADRVRDRLGAAVADPVIDEFWPLALAARATTDRLGLRFALARHGVESSWGVNNLEVPLSAVCETEGFFWFASHLLARLPKFREVHNDALIQYRKLHGIRSRHHPVPALAQQGDWLEAPFWVWRAEEPRRRPLMARQLARTLELRIAGEDAPFAEIPLGPDREACCAVDRLMSLAADGVRIRTRALTTTMFARLLVGDLFIHGIGGAKYDELGDEITRRFFGFPAPAYLTLSMTLWLGLPHDPEASARLHAVDRRLRDLTYNPDRFVEGSADHEVASILNAKRAAIDGPVETHPDRIERFRRIRALNESLQDRVAAFRSAAEEEHARLVHATKRGVVARSREYAFVLHSSRRLREAFQRSVGRDAAPLGV